MVERTDQPAERALSRLVVNDGAGGLGLLHEIGEGLNRIARHDLLRFATAKGHSRAGFAPHDAGVGDTPGERLREEVGHHFLQLPPLAPVGQIVGLARRELHPRRRLRA
jgi:hypothetical protein